jgi:hydroxymethylbilane synthase
VCKETQIHITGFVASVDGKQMLIESATGSREHAEALGQKLAHQLIAKGADKILATL